MEKRVDFKNPHCKTCFNNSLHICNCSASKFLTTLEWLIYYNQVIRLIIIAVLIDKLMALLQQV